MKKTEICLHKLPRNVAANIRELEKDLPLKICDDGVLLEIEKNNWFAVEKIENSAKIYYTKDCEIYAGVTYRVGLFIGYGRLFEKCRKKSGNGKKTHPTSCRFRI